MMVLKKRKMSRSSLFPESNTTDLRINPFLLVDLFLGKEDDIGSATIDSFPFIYLFQICGASLPDVKFQSQAIEALQVGQLICIFRCLYFLENLFIFQPFLPYTIKIGSKTRSLGWT